MGKKVTDTGTWIYPSEPYLDVAGDTSSDDYVDWARYFSADPREREQYKRNLYEGTNPNGQQMQTVKWNKMADISQRQDNTRVVQRPLQIESAQRKEDKNRQEKADKAVEINRQRKMAQLANHRYVTQHAQLRPAPEKTVVNNQLDADNLKGTYQQRDFSFADALDLFNMSSYLPAALRQLINTLSFNGALTNFSGSNNIQTNRNFDQSYLENLSQLGQVAYRQYVRRHGYPRIGEEFLLPLNPSVYKEMNPSNKYADFTDIAGMTDAFLGGNRQVEYTDGGMSGKAVLNSDGMIKWNPTDVVRWDFDPGQEQSLEKRIMQGSVGSGLRYFMGQHQKFADKIGYQPLSQSFVISFPKDTITANPPRYDNVPKYKQEQ